MILDLGPWEPDSAGVGTRAPDSGRLLLEEARGVWPCKTGYIPIPALEEFATFALPSQCLGLFTAYVSAGSYVTFAGTRTKLYKFDTTNGWVDYTRAVGGDYNVPVGDYWSMTQFGSQVIFVNLTDAPQVIDVDTGATAFSALGGSPPNSRYVAVVGDFVILANQTGEPRRITNSAINDATGWTVGTLFCDQQDFPDGEAITGMAGGENGWVVQQHAIRRMIFQPGYSQAFRFNRVEREHGAAAGYSVIAVKDTLFFASDDGFYRFDEQSGLIPIGHRVINDWFNDNSDSSRFYSILGFTDPFAPRIGWALYNTSASTAFDRVLYYDWSLNRFTYDTQEAQFWARTVTAGTTLEALDSYGDMDGGAIPFSLDDRAFNGGAPVMAAVNSAGRLAFLSGTGASPALLRTGPNQLSPPSHRTALHSVYPIGVFNDATLTMRVGERENPFTDLSYTAALSPSSRTGIIHVRKGGKVHNFEFTITQSGGERWFRMDAVDVVGVPDGLG
jgi:hypothetical protein